MNVLVVGGGLAGLTATLRAAELGARVTLLEKGDWLGGSFVYSSGYAWSYKDLPTFRQQAPGGDPTLQKLVLERLKPDLAWLETGTHPALTHDTGNPLTFGARFDPEQIVAALTERIESSGGRIIMGTALTGLLRNDKGRVTGARVSSDRDTVEQSADGVILASGGFAADPDLVSRYITGGAGGMRLRAHPRSSGDGLRAALEADALTSTGLDEFYGRNLPAHPAEFSTEQFVEVSQLYGRYAVAINARGERYADENADWSETALTRATARQPDLHAWYVLDEAGLRSHIRERTAGEMVETARRIGGTVLQAPSLEGLVGQLAKHGLPRNSTLRTLDEYNTAVASEKGAELSPPRTGTAAPLRTPPFVAVEVAPTITHTIGGLAVDGGCRVLRRSDELPIPGLFAAGVEVGGVSTGGYTSGLAAALVFGMTAAESAIEDNTPVP